MAKLKRITGPEVLARIQDRLDRYDRGPFREMLTDAVAQKPSLTAWRKLAAKDPEKWSRAVTGLAKTAGFADRSESVNVKLDINELIDQTISRYGPDRARAILASMNLPLPQRLQESAQAAIPETKAQAR